MSEYSVLLETVKDIHRKIDGLDERVRNVETKVQNGLTDNVQTLVNSTQSQEERLAMIEEQHATEREIRRREEKKWMIIKGALTVLISAGLLIVGVMNI